MQKTKLWETTEWCLSGRRCHFIGEHFFKIETVKDTCKELSVKNIRHSNEHWGFSMLRVDDFVFF